MLEVSDLGFSRQHKKLFSSLNASFPTGKITYIVGPNGVGKTTLLKILCGLLTPEEGDVLFNQKSIYQDFDSYSRSHVFVGHQAAINDVLTVEENLAFFYACYDCSEAALDSKALLKKIGLYKHRLKMAYQLSAGQRRRLSLTRLFVSRANTWILDEPFTSLDKETVALLESWIVAHCQSGGTVIMTSHQTPAFPDEMVQTVDLAPI